MENQPGVGGENEVGQTRLRSHALNANTEGYERVVQLLPLSVTRGRRRPRATGSSRIDFVFDAVVVRRAHEDSRRHIDLP